MNDSLDTEKCPLEAVDKRLEDVHRMWHQAEEAYFDPDSFRVAVQGAIQTLRTVTFILQKNKNLIPDFERWYGKWQEKMKASDLMRWMVDARNKIEKQGDLESRSYVKSEIIASHLQHECPSVEVPSELFQNPLELLHNLPEALVEQHLLKHGVLHIQRRWVENSLPEYELLEAIAIAYGFIAELVHDAHIQTGLRPPSISDCNSGREISSSALKWRLPCMIGHEEQRSMFFQLKDGAPMQLGRRTIEADQTLTKDQVVKHYGHNPIETMGREYETYEEMADAFFEMVRNVFLKDKHHLTLVFLYDERKLVDMRGVDFEGPQDKYLLMRHLAQEVVRIGADGIIMVSEAWFAAQEDLTLFQRPSESPKRKESLLLSLITKTGGSTQYTAEIIRNGEEVSLGETEKAPNAAAFSFAPLYAAWGLQIPPEWVQKLQEGYKKRSENDNATKALVLGGYGNFGKRIAAALVAKGIPVVIAGRNQSKATALAGQLGSLAKAVSFDAHVELAEQLATIKPKVVINTCGPFQNSDYQVAETCIAHGVHYIDLADGREFVTGIRGLDTKAKEAGVTVVSGASTVPGLSSAVLEHYKHEFAQIDYLKFGISPGQQAERGLATTKGIMTYVGKPLAPFPSIRERVYGWQDIYRQEYPELGKRWMANCDIPDLDLLPEVYDIKRLQFSAGLELSLMHLGLWGISWLVRLGVPLNLPKLAGPLLKISDWFNGMGCPDGGMHVIIQGIGKDGQPCTRRWFIIAKGGHGPHIPTIPAIVLAEQLATSSAPAVAGAYPCVGLVSLENYLKELEAYNITTCEV